MLKKKASPKSHKEVYKIVILEEDYGVRRAGIKVERIVADGTKYILKTFNIPKTIEEGKNERDNTQRLQQHTEYVAKVINTFEDPNVHLEILYEYGGNALKDYLYVPPAGRQNPTAPSPSPAPPSASGSGPSQGTASLSPAFSGSAQPAGFLAAAEDTKEDSIPKITPQDMIQIMLQVLDAYIAMQKLNMVHSDIKAHNIVYDAESKKARIIDLGSSFVMRNQDSIFITYNTGQKGEMMSGYTACYTAPELLQRACRDKIYAAIDVYSFGMTFYQMLLNKSWQILIFENEIWKAHEAQYPHFLAEVRTIHLEGDHENQLSSKLVELLLACFAFNPHKRPTFAACYAVLAEMQKAPGEFETHQQQLLTTCVATSESIEFYNVKDRPMTSYEAFLLADKINTIPNLRKLVVYNQQLNDISGELIMKAIIGHPHISFLNFCPPCC